MTERTAPGRLPPRPPTGRSKTAPGQATRERLILTAERLFAERGFHVTSRDILAAADHRNDNGIAYHFGDRDELVTSVALYRVEEVDAVRHRMIDDIEADSRPGDEGRVRRLLDACIVPLAQQRGAGHFLRFAARLQSDFGQWARFSTMPGVWDGWSRAVAMLQDELSELSPDEVRHRMDLVATLVVSALASRVTLELDAVDQSERFEPWFERLTGAAESIVGGGAHPRRR